MDPDEHIEKIAGELRAHLKEKCHEAHLNGEGWRVSVSTIHWDGCNATWQVVLLAPGELPIDSGTIIAVARHG